MSKKKILFLCQIHGNEAVGRWIWNNYPQGENDYCRWSVIVGNPEAMFLNKRYIDEDLNRSFNIDEKDRYNCYEHKRALELKKVIQEYDVVYDIHQTSKSMQDCIFVNNTKEETLKALEPLSQQWVIIDDHPDYSGHFATSVAKVGVTIEYAHSGDYNEETERLQEDFYDITRNVNAYQEKTFLRNYKAISRKHENVPLRDFQALTAYQKARLGIDEKGVYYPLFVDTYPDYYCFIAREDR